MSTLVTVTGHDHPGVTAALMDVLTRHGATVEDIEQVVVHGRLLLGLVVSGEGSGEAVFADLEAAAHALGVEVELEQLADAEPAPAVRHHVVVLGAPLPPAALAGVTRRLAACGANIETVTRLSSWPAQSFELVVSGGDTAQLRRELAAEAVAQRVDVAVERGSIYRRARRLVVMDVDSTLVQGEVIEMLAAEAGCEAQVARVTAAVRLTPGARTLVRTLKHLGWTVGIVSGGFTVVTDDLREQLGLDHALANVLEVRDGRLTGQVVGPVVDRAAKAAALRRFAEEEGLRPEQTVAIGDGANDLDMLAAAGLGIAFNAKPVVRDAADAAISVPFLDAVLFLLGIPRAEVEQAG
jgi:phosphoserine phosphatase